MEQNTDLICFSDNDIVISFSFFLIVSTTILQNIKKQL